MKRLVLSFGLLFVGLSLLWCSPALSSSEKEALEQIVQELNEIVDEQQTIIENSQNRNEVLEKSLKTQNEKISELQSLSESRQKTIEEQEKTISGLENSLKKPTKSSLLTLINSIVASLLSFAGGFILGIFLL